MLANSRCEVLSVLNLKDAFIYSDHLNLQEDSVKFYHILAVHHIFMKECLRNQIYFQLYGNIL